MNNKKVQKLQKQKVNHIFLNFKKIFPQIKVFQFLSQSFYSNDQFSTHRVVTQRAVLQTERYPVLAISTNVWISKVPNSRIRDLSLKDSTVY
jgi:hypothetical protein